MTTRWHEAQVAAVYQSHREQLLRYVRRRATDRGIPDSFLDREGVVQETYLAALRHWPTIRNPGAWLYAVADNLINRASAEISKHAGFDMDHLDEAAGTRWSSVPPRLSVEDAVQVRLTLDSLGQLPGSQGIVIYLSRVHGWSHREIADHLGIEPGGSRVRLMRGTRRLREHWASIVPDIRELRGAATGYRRARVIGGVAAWALLSIVLYAAGLSALGAVLIPVPVMLAAATVSAIVLRWCDRR